MLEGSGLTCAVRDGVGTITITHREKRNAMTREMWQALPPLLDTLAADESVQVVVLTGSGDTFCSGADISMMVDVDPAVTGLSGPAEDALATFAKPTIAAIRGWCVGGGCQLAVACDLRITEEGAQFGITPARIGVVYPGITTARLVHLVGPAAAKFLLFTGDFIDTDRALRIGLVDEVVPAGGLETRVAQLTRTLTTRSQLTLHATKATIAAISSGEPVEPVIRHWQEQGRPELAEGVAAFLERRPARFPWRPGPPDVPNARWVPSVPAETV